MGGVVALTGEAGLTARAAGSTPLHSLCERFNERGERGLHGASGSDEGGAQTMSVSGSA